MSQRAVEQIIGKLVTDDRFRAAFFDAPERTCFCAGLELSPDELRAVWAIPFEAITAFADCLADRIRRLCVPIAPRPPEEPS
ncbi:MAG: Os1348 family NHLP clan protein [Planctomycetota bacterium]